MRDDDNDDANFVNDSNVHLERVHSITEKAMLAHQWKERIEAHVDHPVRWPFLKFWKEIHVGCGSRESKKLWTVL